MFVVPYTFSKRNLFFIAIFHAKNKHIFVFISKKFILKELLAHTLRLFSSSPTKKCSKTFNLIAVDLKIAFLRDYCNWYI